MQNSSSKFHYYSFKFYKFLFVILVIEKFNFFSIKSFVKVQLVSFCVIFYLIFNFYLFLN